MMKNNKRKNKTMIEEKEMMVIEDFICPIIRSEEDWGFSPVKVGGIENNPTA